MFIYEICSWNRFLSAVFYQVKKIFFTSGPVLLRMTIMKAFMKLFYAPIKMIWLFSFNLLIILNHPLMEKKVVSNKTFTPSCYLFSWGGEKRTFYDSENILYFNTIAASNILVPEKQKKIQAFYNKLSFAFSSNSKENTPILFNIMTWGVIFFSNFDSPNLDNL